MLIKLPDFLTRKELLETFSNSVGALKGAFKDGLQNGKM